MHAKLNIVELRVGLSKVGHFEIGKRMVLYYGLGAILVPGKVSFVLPLSRISRIL